MRLLVGGGARGRSFLLLVSSLAALLSADTIYVLQQLAGAYRVGGYEPTTWVGRRLDELVVGADGLALVNLSVLANHSGTAESDVRFVDRSALAHDCG